APVPCPRVGQEAIAFARWSRVHGAAPRGPWELRQPRGRGRDDSRTVRDRGEVASGGAPHLERSKHGVRCWLRVATVRAFVAFYASARHSGADGASGRYVGCDLLSR